MTLAETCARIADAWRLTKLKVHGLRLGPMVPPPTIHYRLPESTSQQMLVVYGDPVGNLPGAFHTVRQLGRPEHVVVAMDSYMAEECPEFAERGQMAIDFRDNPVSTVREALCVTGIDTASGRQHHLFIPYGTDDRGAPRFEEPFATDYAADELPDGRVPQMLSHFFGPPAATA